VGGANRKKFHKFPVRRGGREEKERGRERDVGATRRQKGNSALKFRVGVAREEGGHQPGTGPRAQGKDREADERSLGGAMEYSRTIKGI